MSKIVTDVRGKGIRSYRWVDKDGRRLEYSCSERNGYVDYAFVTLEEIPCLLSEILEGIPTEHIIEAIGNERLSEYLEQRVLK